MHFWPEREYLKSSNVPGYRQFWSKPGKNAQTRRDPSSWELFLVPSSGVHESIAIAKANGVNEHIHSWAAVYEFAIVHPARPNKRVKVYVGKTNNLKERHTQYLNSGEETRMWPFFNHAVKHKCQVWRRFCYFKTAGKMPVNSEPDRAVHQMETRWLSYFDYAWNAQQNPPKRLVFLKPKDFCGIPTGCHLVSEPVPPPNKKDKEATAAYYYIEY